MIRMPVVGELWGRYRLVRELGRGGMGVVYLAVDTSLDRQVAVKIILPNLAGDEDYRARFKREASALSRMDSPHVVQVYDHGELDGCLYLVTQYVPDGDLMDMITRHGAPSPALALQLTEQILSGLVAAHRAGIVHRDVKPSNVLLRRQDGGIDAFLCDFGIASTPGEHLTRTGALVGSFPYMAPERHQGEAAEAAGDIYSAGCLLWQLLTGTPPYAGTDVEVALAHLQAPIPQLPAGGGAFADAINAVLSKALAKDVGERYLTATAMRADLEQARALAPEDLVAPEHTQIRHSVVAAVSRPDATPMPTARRRRGVVGITSAAVLLIAVGGVWVGSMLRDGDQEPREVSAGVAETLTETSLVTVPGEVEESEEAEEPGEGRKQRAQRTRQSKGESDPLPEAAPDPLPESSAAPGSRSEGDRKKSRKPGEVGQGPDEPDKPKKRKKKRKPAQPEETTPPQPAPKTFRCWNGAETYGEDQCSNPSGAAGVQWVFPTAGNCQRKGSSGARQVVYACVFPRGEVIYTQWRTYRAADSSYRKNQNSRNAWRWGTRYSSRTPKRQYTRHYVRLYERLPFSVHINAKNADAMDQINGRIRMIAPERFKGDPI